MKKGKKGIIGALLAAGAGLVGYGIYQFTKKPNYATIDASDDDAYESNTEDCEEESEE